MLQKMGANLNIDSFNKCELIIKLNVPNDIINVIIDFMKYYYKTNDETELYHQRINFWKFKIEQLSEKYGKQCLIANYNSP